MKGLIRVFQRYLVPRFLVSIYYFLRFRCWVSTQAKVQLTQKICFGKGTVVKAFAAIQTGSGSIVFGKKCAISNFNHVAAGDGHIRIGNYVRLGPNVVILGSRRRFRDKNQLIMDQGYSSKGLEIEDDVLVGAGAIIMDGCKIGRGAVIGAGSVVTKDIAPYSLVTGAPARVIGARE